jgi:magnesium transporter
MFMAKLFKQRSEKTGLPPGTLVYVGKERTKKINISVLDYNDKEYNEIKVKKVEDCLSYADKSTVTWINVDGIYNTSIIEKIGEYFKLHPLLQEDIVNTNQRPKMDDYDDYIFIVLKMLDFDDKTKQITSEQVSLILGPDYVISFQEEPEDVFDIVRDRIRHAKGRIRKMGADYLAYALIDAVVDNYFSILEKYGERIHNLEETLIDNPEPEALLKIKLMKREMITLRKSVWPLRELVNNIEKTESKLIDKSTDLFFRDVYDHTIQVIDSVETYRDSLSGMVDLYMSSISNKMNQVMQVLTIIATIFIPLTFIAGIYGMNFDPNASPFSMPELGWYWGYVSVWILMFIITIVMLIYFKKKKWF